MAKPDTFKCAMCKKWSPVSDPAEMLAELRATFGNVPIEQCTSVCDDCYEKIKPDIVTDEYAIRLPRE